jgi:hypothetical protein
VRRSRDLPRLVGRAVVDDDQLEVARRLAEDRAIASRSVSALFQQQIGS